MNDKLKVLVVNPNELPEVQYIDNTLEAKQKIVKGYIEYVYRENYPDIVFVCNEEGKINGMTYNRSIGQDIIAGPFIIAGDDPELEDVVSLTDEQIQKYQKVFNEKSISETNIELTNLFLKQSELSM